MNPLISSGQRPQSGGMAHPAVPDTSLAMKAVHRANAKHLATVVVVTALMFLVGLGAPGLVREDGVVESLSALAFGVAAVAGTYKLAVRQVGLPLRAKLGLGLAVVLCALAALSEISFGARLFDFAMPPMAGGGQFDGGHDIVIWLVRRVQSFDLARDALLVLGLVASAAVLAVAAYRSRARIRGWSVDAYACADCFGLIVAGGLLVCAVVLDLLPFYKASVLEEVLEFVAGVCAAWAMRPRPGRAERAA